jgi:hypothetical protein
MKQKRIVVALMFSFYLFLLHVYPTSVTGCLVCSEIRGFVSTIYDCVSRCFLLIVLSATCNLTKIVLSVTFLCNIA